LAQAASVCFLWLLYQINWNMLSILLAAQLTAHARPLDAAPASVGLLPSRAAQPIMPVLAQARLRGGAAPSDAELTDRYVVTRAYDEASAAARAALAGWTKKVGKGKQVGDFGAKAQALIEDAAATMDAVEPGSDTGAKMLSARKEELVAQIQEDVRDLFRKQHRLLTGGVTEKYKSQLLRVMARAGAVGEWQLEALRKSAERKFDAGCADLLLEGVVDATRAQLATAFSSHLTKVTGDYLNAPAMQLEKLGAMSRASSASQKPPRGIHTGLGLVLSLKNKWLGGNGNVQTFAGYTAGLNSMHVQFANDQSTPDSTGAEPPAIRWQPKLNFDISV